MAIINRPKTEPQQKEALVSDLTKQEFKLNDTSNTESIKVEVETPPVSSLRKAIPIFPFLTMLAGIAIMVIGYYFYDINDQPEPLNQVHIETSIASVAKLGALTSLTKREFEANFVSLEAASEYGSENTISALEIIVRKNRTDLANYHKRFAASIGELHALYLLNPEQSRLVVQAEIDKASKAESSERERILNQTLEIIQNAPSDVDDIQQFIQATIEMNP